jgi:hypothetical protein
VERVPDGLLGDELGELVLFSHADGADVGVDPGGPAVALVSDLLAVGRVGRNGAVAGD